MKLKIIPLAAFLFAFIAVGFFVFSYSKTKITDVVKVKTALVVPPPAAFKPQLIAVDYDHASLSEIAVFLTSETGISLYLDKVDSDQKITWSNPILARAAIFDSFRSILPSFGLSLVPLDKEGKVFAFKNKVKTEPSQVLLDYGVCSKGVFFVYDDKVYSKDDFPYLTKRINGRWYGFIQNPIPKKNRPSSPPTPPAHLAANSSPKV